MRPASAVSAMPPPMVQLDDEEVRKLKREAAIRQKEEEFDRRRLEDEEKKRGELERLKKEYEEGEAKRRADKVAALQKQAKVRAQRHLNNETLNQKRDKNIKKREEVWKKDANLSVLKLVKDKEAWDERVEERLDQARARKAAKENEERVRKQETALAQEELDEKRDTAIPEKLLQWTIREALRTDNIKEEAQQELLSFIQNPFPVPLKQVLCGRLRPVPSVTELLASHKDACEEFEDLKGQDFEMRAVLRNQSLFQYVHDIQAAAEENRIRPPEPVAGDLMKKSNKAPKSPKSPKSPQRSTGRFGKKFAGN